MKVTRIYIANGKHTKVKICCIQTFVLEIAEVCITQYPPSFNRQLNKFGDKIGKSKQNNTSVQKES